MSEEWPLQPDASGWIPVSERKPPKNMVVLVASVLHPGEFLMANYISTVGWLSRGENLRFSPTHWLTLPEPPKRDGD